MSEGFYGIRPHGGPEYVDTTFDIRYTEEHKSKVLWTGDCREIAIRVIGFQEIEDCREKYVELKRRAQLFCNLCATCCRVNTSEWMEHFATELSLFAQLLGDHDRVEYMPTGGNLRIVHQYLYETHGGAK